MKATLLVSHVNDKQSEPVISKLLYLRLVMASDVDWGKAFISSTYRSGMYN